MCQKRHIFCEFQINLTQLSYLAYASLKMLKIFVSFLSLNLVHSQNVSMFRFSAINQVELPEMAGIVTVANQSMSLGSIEELGEKQSEANLTSNLQCLYDFQGNRVNKGCLISDRPVKCEKGTLVQTTVGVEYEMCCCNFAVIL